jgi:plasmid maintenance system antidote protein VapI
VTTDRQPPHHNTLTCYTNYGCRRPECVERKRAWARERDRSLKAGTWQPFVDATPVREHIQQLLESNITIDAIARTVGVPRESIIDFTHQRRRSRGLRHSTDPQLAAKILAVTPDTIDAGRVDATGSHRRIQALIAAGWPLIHIGRQFGMHEQRPEQILRCKRVYAATRRQVADGYERVSRLRPEHRGVPRQWARLSRERAAANRWPNPGYWADRMDVIDDPDFEPLYGVTKREIVAQDANWIMRTTGLDRAAAAERLGVHKSYLDHALRDHPQYAVEVAA